MHYVVILHNRDYSFYLQDITAGAQKQNFVW